MRGCKAAHATVAFGGSLSGRPALQFSQALGAETSVAYPSPSFHLRLAPAAGAAGAPLPPAACASASVNGVQSPNSGPSKVGQTSSLGRASPLCSAMYTSSVVTLSASAAALTLACFVTAPCVLCVERQRLVLLRHVFLVVHCVLSFFDYGAPPPCTGAPMLRTGAPWAAAPVAADAAATAQGAPVRSRGAPVHGGGAP